MFYLDTVVFSAKAGLLKSRVKEKCIYLSAVCS